MVVAIPELLLGVVFNSGALSLVQYAKDDTLNWIRLVAYLTLLGYFPTCYYCRLEESQL
ncbi:hypothetical protein [Phyllobacterium myrsinacearum]|uniref:Uncharacterized protein n=1 Tax=Phyllobacterium myrsinacearum TaxID=28101 RepID=A0A839EP33_9HYPH|nr:hypothetical protein [Phyllobacterium myrsinacearum]MBA8881841.1 hypothetical protein [Phyllobacterium myrsinacearum]